MCIFKIHLYLFVCVFGKCFFRSLYARFHVKKKKHNNNTWFLCQLSFFLFVFKHSVFNFYKLGREMQKFHIVGLNAELWPDNQAAVPHWAWLLFPHNDKGALRPRPAPPRMKQLFLKDDSALNLSWTLHIQISMQLLLWGTSCVSDTGLVILSDGILWIFM